MQTIGYRFWSPSTGSATNFATVAAASPATLTPGPATHKYTLTTGLPSRPRSQTNPLTTLIPSYLKRDESFNLRPLHKAHSRIHCSTMLATISEFVCVQFARLNLEKIMQIQTQSTFSKPRTSLSNDTSPSDKFNLRLSNQTDDGCCSLK